MTQKISDNALNTALLAQKGAQALQTEQEAIKTRLLSVEMEMKQFSLKIRGLSEDAEQNKDLQTALAMWLATALGLEEGISPVITKAYRLGVRKQLKSKGPRDILLTLSDLRVKNRIITEARKKGFLMLAGQKVEIYNDLPSEAINKRKKLKPITSCLQQAKQKYKWDGPAKLMVVYKGSPLYATDIDSGIVLLNTLGIKIPEEATRKTAKRKLDLVDTPTKDS